MRADGPDGVSVEWTNCEESSIADEVDGSLRRLIHREAVSPDDIGVLAPSPDILMAIKSALRGHFPQMVALDTVADFKGLERSVVLLAATREIADQREIAYVALSRACAHLIIIGGAGVLQWLGQLQKGQL